MNIVGWFLASVGIGFCLCCLWLGIQIGLDMLSRHYHWNIFPGILDALAVAPILFIIIVFSGKYMFRLSSILNGTSWIIIICTVLLTVWIASFYKHDEEDMPKTKKEFLSSGLNGLLMEVPQRWMMQTFLLYLLSFSKMENTAIISTAATATVWCIGICAEAVMEKVKPDANFWIELISSFVFSCGVGIVFAHTELILFPMVAHFMERILNNYCRSLKFKRSASEY